MNTYCTQIQISERIRVDLFTSQSFRVRRSWLEGDPFPRKYEIPFAVGATQPWQAVPFTSDAFSDNTMVRIETDVLVIYVRVDTGRFMVYRRDGTRLYPTDDEKYGMFVNHCIVFDSASFHNEYSSCSRFAHWFYNAHSGEYSVHLSGDELLDVFFIYGETYAEGYRLFSALVGAEPLLPRKGYGSMQTQHLCASGDQQTFLRLAEELRARNIPCDTLILDYEWGDGADGGRELPWGSRLDWSSSYMQPYTPQEMLRRLNEQHFSVMTIRHSLPYAASRSDGSWANYEYSPELWWRKLREQTEIGVVGTWQDTRKTDVTNSRICHGLQKLMGDKRFLFMGNYDVYSDSCWTKECVMTPEKQNIGCRRTPFYWTGDARMTEWEDLRYQINAIVGEHGALKGISYLTNDGMRSRGGAYAVRCDQFLALNSVHRSHNCKPWERLQRTEEYAETMAIGKKPSSINKNTRTIEEKLGIENEDLLQQELIKQTLELRYALLPYIYTTARQTYDVGLPMTRPLMVAFEKDENCNKNQYPLEYMLGETLLVCPVYTDAEKMRVYLPAGANWVDYFTGETYAGGREYDADISDLAKFPLYVKAGSILTTCRVCGWVDNADKDLILTVYGQGKSEFVLYEDDGETLDYRAGEYARTKICCTSDEKGAEIILYPAEGNYAGMPQRRNVTIRLRGAERTAFIDCRKKTILKI